MPREPTGRPAGRPTADLSVYRFQIEEWKSHQRLTDAEILRRLASDYNLKASQSTLYRNLKRWGTSFRTITQDSTELRDRIKYLFFQQVLNDHWLLLQLHSDGFLITKTGLARIRKELQLWRRQDDIAQLAPQIEKLREFYESESKVNTFLHTYGRTYLYTYVRQNGHSLSRSVLYETFREFYPLSVTDRWNTMRYRRVGWTAPGPDFIWSIDAHDKLKAWGFEIYASIDAYSRYIPWFYIGISAGTSRSVLGQYLRVLSERGKMPNLVRSDRGGETVLMAGAHFYLSQLRVRVRDGIQHDVTLDDCWIYGKSTSNEKIESWWLRFSRGRGGFWRKFFITLTETGRFSNDSLADRIAMLYIYMPVLRDEFSRFVMMWNAHYIRKQSNRPHVIPGQPYVLYHQAEAHQAVNFAEIIPEDRLESLQNMLAADPYDLDGYLPDDTMDVCDAFVERRQQEEEQRGEDQGRDSAETPCLSMYLALRQYLQNHIDENKAPAIGLLESPTGGLDRFKSHLGGHGIDVQGIETRLLEAEEQEVNY